MTIGIFIAELLKANTALMLLVPETSIYPYVINENTPLPAIIYTVNSLDSEYNKDGWVADDCSFSVVSFSADYASLQNIVTQVREALELKKGTNTHRITLVGQSEGYNITENVFLNKLTFSVRIFDY